MDLMNSVHQHILQGQEDKLPLGETGGVGDINNISININAKNKMQPVTNLKLSRDKERIPQELVQELRATSNLIQLGQITLENVLNCLVERFHSKQYYTFAGSVLISLNPCLNVSSRQSLGDLGCLMKYREACLQVENSETSVASVPHVYAIGLRSLKNLQTAGNNQIIVVSGDSGAGKTTCTQQLIRYFTEIHIRDGCTNNVFNNLEKKIYYATVILESFGNASTTANPNSSRFGRLVQLCYNQDTTISGASIKTYLLEKHRVTNSVVGERNFHVFYYILEALQSGHMKIEDMNGECNNNYEEMLPIELLNGMKKSDGDDLKDFLQALKVLDLSEDFLEVFRVVFAIMHLIDVGFIQQRDDEDYDSDTFEDSLDQPIINIKEYTVSTWNKERVSISCSILGLNEADLVDAFIARKITAAAKGRHSIFRKACERESECEERAQSFVTTLYDKLFHHVLSKVNGLLQQEVNVSSQSSVVNNSSELSDFGGGDNNRGNYAGKLSEETPNSTLSLLDLYGFENLEYNHLEQLCINYANERLQEVQISTLKNYFKEEASLEEIDAFEESSELLRVEREIGQRMEELHQHLFSILDEECLLKRCTADKSIFERISLATKSDKFISTGRPHETDCPFTIKHYAMNVKYHMSGMPDKNKDYVPREFSELCKSSTNSFVVSLFQDQSYRKNNSLNTPRNKNDSGKTILARFRNSVKDLMSELQSDGNQDLHFIRCIRPNTDLVEGKIQTEVVKTQLYSCGIVDVVRIAGSGYPIRVKVSKFGREFPKILKFLSGGEFDAHLVTLAFSFPNRPLKIGSSIVFMNENSWMYLKKFENFIAQSSARTLQLNWRWYMIQQRAEAERLKTPSPSHLPYYNGDSINATTYWYTPATHSNTSGTEMFSTPVSRPGPYGDTTTFSDSMDMDTSIDKSMGNVDSEVEALGINLSTNIDKSMGSMGDVDPEEKTLLHDEKSESTTETPVNRSSINSNLQGLFSKHRLVQHGGIVSRNPIHTLPIKIYAKKTAMGVMKHPQRLVANGLQDAFNDYGILTYKPTQPAYPSPNRPIFPNSPLITLRPQSSLT